MIWIPISLLCSVACLIGLGFSGVVYRTQQNLNRARRLEISSRRQMIALVPEEYRARSKRDEILFCICILTFSALFFVFQLFYAQYLEDSLNLRLFFAVATIVSVPFVWNVVDCFRRSRQKIAELGQNPFSWRRFQLWLFIGHPFFVLLTVENLLLIRQNFVEAMCVLPLQFALVIVAIATDSEMSWHENGIFLGTRFYTWDEITWYRWYQNRCGIVFGHNRWQFPCPLHYLPAEEIGSDRLAALLEQYLPGKERETVEDYLAMQESSAIDATEGI